MFILQEGNNTRMSPLHEDVQRKEGLRGPNLDY